MIQAERKVDFDAVAEQRYANLVSSGKTIPWADIRRYLEAHVIEKPAKRPVAHKLARGRDIGGDESRFQ